MLIGYVSDEKYVALADVAVELLAADGRSYAARSRASGAIHLEVPAGDYEVILTKPGYGSKVCRWSSADTNPRHFRLLADGLLGYVWPKCVRSGEKGEFRVHAVEQYKLELWRYGWEKELVRGLGWHDEHGPRATMQITPDGDYSQSGVQWNKIGYGSPSHQQFVVAPERSGLYYFHASTPSGLQFSFPWVVAPAQPRARIAVLASNITWNAYNNFGGRSNYISADELPEQPIVNARQQLKRYTQIAHQTWGSPRYSPLSFDRPEPINHIDLQERITDPIEGRAACHLAPAEWRLLGWLERERWEFDLYAETQLHEGLVDLAAYRVLIISTHPEYWTRTMYERVKHWVYAEGGRLVYLGGNGLNCEVDLIDERTMVVHNGVLRGLWPEEIGAESRMAKRVESEANLLGVVFTPSGFMTGAPYRVVAADHWAFAGTGLAAGEPFGERSLHRRCPGGASGHETDKCSPSSPANVELLAEGLNPDGGGAQMVTFETPSGGAVFSVGSICYPSSLPVDERISRITNNVLRRFLMGLLLMAIGLVGGLAQGQSGQSGQGRGVEGRGQEAKTMSTNEVKPTKHAVVAAESSRGMVATVQPLATRAGVAALERGGNALDAAVAAALTLGVVDGHNSGIGGGCLILMRRADGRIVAIDGRETAPAKAHRRMYLDAAERAVKDVEIRRALGAGPDANVSRQNEGQSERGAWRATDFSQTGALAVAIPGALAAYDKALREHGRLTLADLLLPAARVAEEGFEIDRIYAANLAEKRPLLSRFPGSRAVLLKPDGAAYREGERLCQTDLAKSYRAIAREGVNWFYRGTFARQVETWMRAHGGIVTASDFANYRPREREPLVSRYRDYTVVGFPPPSSGGVHVAQMLHMLEPFPLREWLHHDPVKGTHVIVEAMKLAFADRAHWLGDPDFVRVPRGLVDREYGRELGRGINAERVTAVNKPGTPPNAATDVFGKHTTHVAAADAEGNWVAITATINTSFGSKVIVPETGIILNNEMDDFAVEPGVPNAFGLVGADANAVEPEKRPLSSMSPTIVMHDEKPVFTVGAAGGPTIISQVLLAIVRQIDAGQSAAAAIAATRFHHQWLPNVVRIEESADELLVRELKSAGHVLELVSRIGVSQAISWDAERRLFVGVSDPRVPGLAAGPSAR